MAAGGLTVRRASREMILVSRGLNVHGLLEHERVLELDGHLDRCSTQLVEVGGSDGDGEKAVRVAAHSLSWLGERVAGVQQACWELGKSRKHPLQVKPTLVTR